MNFIAFVQMLSHLAPLVTSAVNAAETIIGPGKGTEKLKRATEEVTNKIPAVVELAHVADEARRAVVPLIEATVSAANASIKRGQKPRPKKGRASKR